MAHFAQAHLHLGAQGAQVGGGDPGVGAHGLRLYQHGVDFEQAGAHIGQQRGELLDSSLAAIHRGLGAVHQAFGAKNTLVGLGQQGVGVVQRGDDFLGVVFAAQHAGQQAVAAGQALAHGLQIAQAGVEAGLRAGHALQVFQQGAGRGHDARNLGVGVAAQHGAFGAGGQRRVGQDAAEGANARLAHHAALHGEDAGGAQPARVFARHVNHHARLAVCGQLDAAYAPNRKTRKRQVHADDDAF